MTGKPKLVLVPGLLCSDTLWTAQTEGLADIADIIVADITRDDTMDGMAQRILDGVNGSFSLAGLSMGGYVAFEVMRRALDGSTGWPCWTRVRAPTRWNRRPGVGT